MNVENVSHRLQEISDIIRWRGVFSEYDYCANLLMDLLKTDDTVLINDILMNFSNPVYWKDVCSDYQWCSSNYASLLALDDANKIMGKSDFDFGLNLQMANDVQEADELALIQGRMTVEEREVALPDGTVRHLKTKRFPIYDDEDHIIGLLGVVREVFVSTDFALNSFSDLCSKH